jgi:hypothetical protein
MFGGMRFLLTALALCTVPAALGTAAASEPPNGAIIGSETSLGATSDSDFAVAVVDESGDDHIVTREARSGALRYLKVHEERIAVDELITAGAKDKDRQKHQPGFIIDGSGQPVVWSAGHQYLRDVGSGQWREMDSTIGCERIVEFRNHLVCLAVVPGRTFNAPKHWIFGIVGGYGPGALPWAWRVNTDTLALFGEEQNLWQPVAIIDRDSKVDATGPYDLAVDARDRLHILSRGDFRHAIYAPTSEVGKDEPRQFASLVSDPVVVRFTAPYKSHPDTLTAWPGIGMPGPSSDAVWSRSYLLGEAFDPVSAEFTFLLGGWSAHGKAFSTAPDSWLGTWRLHDAQGEGVQTLAMSPDGYLVGRMAGSSNGRMHAVIVRIPKKDGIKTIEYLSYDGTTWSSSVPLNPSRPIKTLYALASNHSGQVVIVYASADGNLIAWSIVDRPTAP